ncbi:hypothetical protein [Hydrogenimonas sp.]
MFGKTLFFFSLILGSFAIVGCQKVQTQTGFEKELEALHQNRIDSIDLSRYFNSFTINPLYQNSEIDQMVLDEAPFSSERLTPLKPEDILMQTDRFVLIKSSDRKYLFPRLFAMTLDRKGGLIEAIVLAMNEGNSEVKISRNFDYFNDIPYRFDATTATFTAIDLRYDTEWIEPARGVEVVTYKTKVTWKVDEKGHFELVNKVELPHRL